MWGIILQTPRSEKNEWEEVLQAPDQRFPCSPWQRQLWSRNSLAVHSGADAHTAAYFLTLCQSRQMSNEGTAAHGEAAVEQASLKGLQPIENMQGSCSGWLDPHERDPMPGLGRGVRRKEQQEEAGQDWQIHSPPLCEEKEGLHEREWSWAWEETCVGKRETSFWTADLKWKSNSKASWKQSLCT